MKAMISYLPGNSEPSTKVTLKLCFIVSLEYNFLELARILRYGVFKYNNNYHPNTKMKKQLFFHFLSYFSKLLYSGDLFQRK